MAEYVTLQSEEAWLGSLVGGVGEGKNATSAPSGWPHSGGVTFANYSMAYREGLPLVLDGVNLEIKAGDKVQKHINSQPKAPDTGERVLHPCSQ